MIHAIHDCIIAFPLLIRLKKTFVFSGWGNLVHLNDLKKNYTGNTIIFAKFISLSFTCTCIQIDAHGIYGLSPECSVLNKIIN
jgi:hypothetical protein